MYIKKTTNAPQLQHPTSSGRNGMPDRGRDQEGDTDMAQRIQAEVTMMNIYKYEAPAYGYGTETRYIYTMQDEAGTVYV